MAHWVSFALIFYCRTAVGVHFITAQVCFRMYNTNYGRLCNRADHYTFILFLSSSSFLFPRLISAVGDWMSTILPHIVWP